MAKKSNLRVGVIGYGPMGRHHAAAWADIPDIVVAAVAERLPERRNEASRDYGCPVFESAEEMCRSAKPDIAVIATTVPAHHDDTLSALRNGCHVICEKPMALTLKEADEMVEAAKKRGLLLAVHHQAILAPQVRYAERLLQEEKIGEFYFIQGYGKGRPVAYELLEEVTHALHAMRHFAGSDPAWVFGHIEKDGRPIARTDIRPAHEFWPKGRESGLGAGDYIHGYYHFSGGVAGAVTLKTIEEISDEYAALELHGTRGRLRMHFSNMVGAHKRIFFSPHPYNDLSPACWEEMAVDNALGDEESKESFMTLSTREFARDFLGALREGRSPTVTGEDGRAALEMAHGIYASHFIGNKPVPFPLADRNPFRL